MINGEGNTVCGLYRYIEDSKSCSAHRFIGDNGLPGYLTVDGKILGETIYTRAEPMRDGSAYVGEEDGSVYYTDKDGNRFTRDYSDGFSFSETQGNYARVRLKDISGFFLEEYAMGESQDGLKGIVDWKGEIIVPAEYVEIGSDHVYSLKTGDDDMYIFRAYKKGGTCDVFMMKSHW